MRLQAALFTGLLFLSLGACTRRDMEVTRERTDRAERDGESAAHKAGRAAYNIAQESKEAAKKAGKELKKAGGELKDGWNEAKQDKRK